MELQTSVNDGMEAATSSATPLDVARSALMHLSPSRDYDGLRDVLFPLRDDPDLQAPESDRRMLALEWAQTGLIEGSRCISFSPEKFNRIWDSKPSTDCNHRTMRSVYRDARGAGWEPPAAIPDGVDRGEDRETLSWRAEFEAMPVFHFRDQAHPYFARKGFPEGSYLVPGSGIRVPLQARCASSCNGTKLPNGGAAFGLYDVRGRLHGWQVYVADETAPKGGKDRPLAKGAKVSGHFLVPFGQDFPEEPFLPPASSLDRFIVAEGLATAASCEAAANTLDTRSRTVGIASVNSNNLPEVVFALRKAYPDTPIIVAVDNDDAGRKAVAKVLAKGPRNVRFTYPRDTGCDNDGRDLNDDHVEYGLEVVWERLQAAEGCGEPESSSTSLVKPAVSNLTYINMTRKGELVSSLANAEVWLKSNEGASDLRFDEFNQCCTYRGERLRDELIPLMVSRMQRAEPSVVWSKEHVRDAIENLCRENSYNSAQELIESFVWDGENRLDFWLQRTFGVADTPLMRAKGRKWLISGAARIFNPGCKADHVLLLTSKRQGIGKTTVFDELALRSKWYLGRLPDLHNKDAQHLLLGKIIVEIKEISAIRKSDVETVKGYLDEKVDNFRPPYGRFPVDVPRTCIFAATSNKENPLPFDDNQRRYWVVRCPDRAADVQWLRENKEQLWAEALHRYREGEAWHITFDDPLYDELYDEQRTLNDVQHPWLDQMDSAIAGVYQNVKAAGKEVHRLVLADPKKGRPTSIRVTVSEVLSALGMPAERQTGAQGADVRKILHIYGGESLGQQRFGGERGSYWLVPLPTRPRDPLDSGVEF